MTWACSGEEEEEEGGEEEEGRGRGGEEGRGRGGGGEGRREGEGRRRGSRERKEGVGGDSLSWQEGAPPQPRAGEVEGTVGTFLVYISRYRAVPIPATGCSCCPWGALLSAAPRKRNHLPHPPRAQVAEWPGHPGKYEGGALNTLLP